MAQPISMMSVALVTAAAAGLLPQLIPVPNVAAPASLATSAAASTAGGAVAGAQTGSGGSVSTPAAKIVHPAKAPAVRLEWNEKHEKQVRGWILLRNDTKNASRVYLSMTAQDRLGRKLDVADIELSKACVEGLPALSDKLCLLVAELSWNCQPPALPATGFLKVSATQLPCKSKPAVCAAARVLSYQEEVTIPERPLRFVGLVVASCLVAALIVVVVTIVRLRRRANPVGLLASMGSSKWDRNSWGTNVTIAGALLGTLLGLSIFPEHPQLMTRDSYTLLNSLFAGLVILAPLLYGLLQRDAQVTTNGVAGIDTQGYVIMFLAAGGIVLWCAIGQAATLFLLARELVLSNAIDFFVGAILEALALILIALLVVYGVIALYRAATRPGVVVTPQAQAARPPAPIVRAGATQAENLAQNITAPPEEWPLL
ncbi:MAG TPA: hypothetical protein VHR45_00680 [Thermoanaerobaculia bacterium]|nr:hypothetical protein [Thermoanaerobaculia bacterium]